MRLSASGAAPAYARDLAGDVTPCRASGAGRVMRKTRAQIFLLAIVVCGCGQRQQRAPGEITFLIESNPANLDPRFASDAQSQRIGALIFSGLVERDARMNLHGDLAESWETPNPLTYVFHLRKGVTFHDGRRVTSADVKTTIEYMMDAANKSPKRGA